MIPKAVESVFVSMDAPFRASEQLSGVFETRPQGLKEYMTDISIENRNTKLPALRVQGLCCTKIAGDVPDGR